MSDRIITIDESIMMAVDLLKGRFEVGVVAPGHISLGAVTSEVRAAAELLDMTSDTFFITEMPAAADDPVHRAFRIRRAG